MKTLITFFGVVCLMSTDFKEDTSYHYEEGIASFYSDYYDGKITASGQVFDQEKMTAAHKTLPFGTVVKVQRKDSDRQIEVVINDRGPFIEGRIIDLSYKAAEELSMITEGIVEVEIIAIK